MIKHVMIGEEKAGRQDPIVSSGDSGTGPEDNLSTDIGDSLKKPIEKMGLTGIVDDGSGA